MRENSIRILYSVGNIMNTFFRYNARVSHTYGVLKMLRGLRFINCTDEFRLGETDLIVTRIKPHKTIAPRFYY